MGRFQLLWMNLVLASLACSSPVIAQPWVPVPATYPSADSLALFQQVSGSTYAIAPKEVRLALDPSTGKPRIGIQYYSDPATHSEKAAITASLEFALDKDKTDALIAWLRSQKGSQISVALMPNGRVGCSLYTIASDGTEAATSAIPASDTTFQSTLPFTLNMATTDKSQMASLLDSSDRLGLLCDVTYRNVGAPPLQATISGDQLKAPFQDIGLIRIADDTDGVADKIFKQIAPAGTSGELGIGYFRAWFRDFLGNPTPSQRLLGGLAWGWDLSSNQFQSRLSSLGTITLFSLVVPGGDRHHYTTVPMDRLCTQFGSQIVSLDDASGGCDALQH